MRILIASAWFLLLLVASPVEAQVVLDGSLGPSGSVPIVDGEYAITDWLGRYSKNGATLFHSFGRDPNADPKSVEGSGFDLGVGDTAHFSATMGMPKRVIARVTGRQRSQPASSARRRRGRPPRKGYRPESCRRRVRRGGPDGPQLERRPRCIVPRRLLRSHSVPRRRGVSRQPIR